MQAAAGDDEGQARPAAGRDRNPGALTPGRAGDPMQERPRPLPWSGKPASCFRRVTRGGDVGRKGGREEKRKENGEGERGGRRGEGGDESGREQGRSEGNTAHLECRLMGEIKQRRREHRTN